MRQDGAGCGSGGSGVVCSKPDGDSIQGVCDLAGNVWEWVQDGYYGAYHGAPEDGRAWEDAETEFRVRRGGSWFNSSGFLRAAVRSAIDPGQRSDDLGFRLARPARP
jgi:formylglycine-generating enzyme required for sulfatase activity